MPSGAIPAQGCFPEQQQKLAIIQRVEGEREAVIQVAQGKADSSVAENRT